jgi:hypothetical protein
MILPRAWWDQVAMKSFEYQISSKRIFQTRALSSAGSNNNAQGIRATPPLSSWSRIHYFRF